VRTRNIRLHTDTILNVLSELVDDSLTKIIVMDSLDWFDRIDPSKPMPLDRYQKAKDVTPEEALEMLHSELDHEILEMKRVLKVGGMAVWRSAGKYPWYRQRFELAGFDVQPIDIRESGIAIDRVNMYASFWSATRKESREERVGLK
jgi:betaine lipid synthase